MILRTVLIGVALIVVAFVAGGLVFPSEVLNLGKVGQENLVLAPNQSTYLQINLNQSGMVVFVFSSLSRLNFYFANATGFVVLQSYIGNNSMALVSSAPAYYGNGILEAVINSSRGSFPYYQQGAVPVYPADNTSILGAGSYYAIIENPSGGFANVSTVTDVTMDLQSKAVGLGINGLMVLIPFVAGAAVIVYGLIQKPKAPETAKPVVDPAYVDSLYKGIDSKKKPAARANKKNKA